VRVALALAVVVLLAACGSSGNVPAPPAAYGAKPAHGIKGRTRPGGNTTNGE